MGVPNTVNLLGAGNTDFRIAPFDKVAYTYNVSNLVETVTYSLKGATVAILTYVYSGSNVASITYTV